MKLSLSPANIFLTSNVQSKKSQNTTLNNIHNLKNDLFVKSTNNVSFKGTLREDYTNIKKSMTEYIMNASEISTKEIEKIIQEYSPSTKFDDIKNVPSGTNVFASTSGYTQSPTQFKIQEDGTFEVEALPKTIYISFRTEATNDKERRIIYLDRILHEVTHLLQDSATDKEHFVDFFNKFSRAESDKEKTINNLKAINFIFNTVEQNMMKIFVNSSPSTGSLPKEINRRLDVDNYFMKKTKMGASSNARNILDKSIKAVNAQMGNIDKNFALEFVVLKAQNEKEAYQNALDSNKELLGIKGKTDFDIRIEMYDSIINAAKGLMDKK